MGRKELAEEIVDFFIEYKIKGLTQEINIAQSKVEKYLEFDWFVENLIQTLYIKTRYIENMDNERLEKLVEELENVRLEVEFF